MTMTAIISHLPMELLDEIISKLSSSSTRAVRLTCKNWDSLFKNRGLMKEEAAAKEGESRMIVLMDNNLCSVSIFFNGIDIDPSAEQKGKLTCLYDDSEQVKISQVFHCEGLLLCVIKDDKGSLVVWNPYLGQTRWIEPRYFFRIPDRYDRYMYALGYNNKSRSHKILRFIDGRQFDCRYEIYDFDFNLWTTLDVTPHWCLNYCRGFRNYGVTLKGNTYWCAIRRNSNALRVDHIICFDFTSERFGPLMYLPFIRDRCASLVTLSCVREEKLAVLFCYYDTVEVWITTKIEAEKMSWSKFLTVKMYVDLLDSHAAGSFFIDELKKVAMIFDRPMHHRDTVHIVGEAGYVKEVDLGEPDDKYFFPLVCSYVPSLVQIKKPAGGQRKQQSSLEKRRCDQNISRLIAHEELVKER
ncbi:hypothetical protein ARALYDRAFT_479757 [Arabidopsis lyrata subsp. lyrata]|uniref:F-box domain-containing protein n=1 Tax=Arabidopsis lyrata subsp. lyrata TaxID=81972 RepID=D7L1P6_ARALL|nr:putative F-box protein At3g22421 [Arabidopsis lyrata subsp. lyrata]EFH61761.1 hypothetical protein ARALYDRAFT_479757 [Arabidopsis lyrata subsp. lyrata]|eukprot:XP_002885502.1 putative F-box protein At3g22421 [Arabidopsis lyrata subsp. lyrata]